MGAVDYIYRFEDQQKPSSQHPSTAEKARLALEKGNRVFSQWMLDCQSSSERQHVVHCDGPGCKVGEAAAQAPLAVVVGCSDARAPVELLFGQSFNDLFVVRAAGNVLGSEGMGSVEYALAHFQNSVKAVVVLGHTECGAVTAAVEAYLQPDHMWDKQYPATIRSILQRIFAAIAEADQGLQRVWSDKELAAKDKYIAALKLSATCINAAQTALDLRLYARQLKNLKAQVYFGVYNIRNFQVAMPVDPQAEPSEKNVHLESAPKDSKELGKLAVNMAEILRPKSKPLAKK